MHCMTRISQQEYLGAFLKESKKVAEEIANKHYIRRIKIWILKNY